MKTVKARGLTIPLATLCRWRRHPRGL